MKCKKCGAILQLIGNPSDLDYICPNCTKVTIIENATITSYSLTERGIEVDGTVDSQKIFDALMDPEVDDFIDSGKAGTTVSGISHVSVSATGKNHPLFGNSQHVNLR